MNNNPKWLHGVLVGRVVTDNAGKKSWIWISYPIQDWPIGNNLVVPKAKESSS